jgi:hypothetical protein
MKRVETTWKAVRYCSMPMRGSRMGRRSSQGGRQAGGVPRLRRGRGQSPRVTVEGTTAVVVEVGSHQPARPQAASATTL